MTPTQQLKLAEAVLAAADATVSSLAATKGTPLQWLLTRAKEDAARAMLDLIDAPAHDQDTIRALQNEARRFRDLVGYIREIIAKGDEAHHALTTSERDELLELVQSEGMDIE